MAIGAGTHTCNCASYSTLEHVNHTSRNYIHVLHMGAYIHVHVHVYLLLFSFFFLHQTSYAVHMLSHHVSMELLFLPRVIYMYMHYLNPIFEASCWLPRK